jgi:hypothetical protein
MKRRSSGVGKIFNRRIHELHHMISHSHGGGNAEGNIPLLTRKKSCSKGAKLYFPTWVMRACLTTGDFFCRLAKLVAFARSIYTRANFSPSW